MNILHISTARTWRGGEQQIAYLINELRQLPNLNQQVICTRGSAMHHYCKKQSIDHIAQTKAFTFNPFFAHKIKQVCKQNHIDIIHAHDPHAHQFAVIAADVFANPTPIVVSRRVDFAIRNSRYTLHKYNHRQVKKIICVSKAIEEIVAQSIDDKTKLCTVYSGIDVSRFNQIASNSLKKQYNIPANALLIGNVAALAPHKDYFTFIDTAQLILDSGVNAYFFAIGEGELHQQLHTYSQQKGIADRVIFTGFRNDVPAILPQLNVFLITSTTEGLGTSILDAFVCRVPVVATAAGGIPELIQHQQTGLLANVKDAKALANAVVSLLNDAHLQQQLIDNAAVFVQQFTKAATAKHTLSIYQQVLTNN